MTYKLLIVRNRFTKSLNVTAGLNWFKANTPVEMQVEEIETDFDVTTEKIGNQTYKGVICGDDIYPKLRTVIPEGKYHAVVFVYGNKLNGIRVNVAKVLPLYPGTDLIQLCSVNDRGKSLNHEIFHTFIHRLQRQQVMVEDPMDLVIVDGVAEHYYNNSNMDEVPSNRSIALERISPYWDKITNILILNKMPIVEITRTISDEKQTLGILEAHNNGAKFSCKTLELAWKNNSQNISCIPVGEYDVKYEFWPSKLKFAYRLQNVPNRTGILFHAGNYYKDIQGCILLGSSLYDINGDGKLDVTSSRETIKMFENFMGKKPFKLRIV